MNVKERAYRWPTKIYDVIAPVYDLWMRIFFRLGSVGQRRVAGNLCEGMLLDIACGTGTMIAALTNAGLNATGMDLSAGMIRQAVRKKSGAKWMRGNYYQLPFPDGVFDYVVETNALSGITVNLDQVLREMLRVCKIGGEVRVADYMQPARHLWKTRLIQLLFAFSGDYAHDLVSHFAKLGYTGSIETLGLSGMYQFIRIKKSH